ncbi:MAG: pyruvate dehydrogenase complex dihydrolipoamide acetyltransferase [Hyphomonadaceae bacterium]|nr:pyruvate dehydrogenase complex dihydrolipoamide acetyltransferase [Hyphomonadaceae bacterium]
MAIDILMPALSPTMEEGNLAKWHVKPGDAVKSGQVIAEIETDKATMEVEAVDEGVVDALLVAEGTEGVKVNAVIARLKGEGDAGAVSAPAGQASEGGGSRSAPERAVASPPQSTLRADNSPSQGSTVAISATAAGDERIPASPLARRMAQLAGIALSGVRGSGPNGRVVKRDIEAAMGKQPIANCRALALAPTTAPAPAQVKTLAQLGVPEGSYDLVPLDLMRKTIARRMTESFRDIPHFPLTVDIELDALMKARADINGRFGDQGVKVSVNDMIIKACALALMRVPEANSSYTPDGLAMHHHADVAVAVAIPGGLITPIIFTAETKGLAQISAEMADLAARARERKLRPEEYQGGTFSLSNLGMMGIKSFASILNEPHAMILSVGAGEKRPVVKKDALAIATVMSVTLTCDHRAVDGAIGSAWLKAFKGFVEDPMSMLL